MFRRRTPPTNQQQPAPARPAPVERITSVLGSGITWKGSLRGAGGVRIEGAFEGEIHLRGLLVVGESGRVTCDHIRAHVVIVAGAVRGDITAQKMEIRSSGRVWGDVVTAAFATEEGAFLRGQITMEERVEIAPPEEPAEEMEADETEPPTQSAPPATENEEDAERAAEQPKEPEVEPAPDSKIGAEPTGVEVETTQSQPDSPGSRQILE
ncbi:MAG TPA: polymer-forming cytoskeletal protein [Anaerolineales bacterium]|nr:polymer-forming cytoskeletal protein [Anaerolineales bacterium]